MFKFELKYLQLMKIKSEPHPLGEDKASTDLPKHQSRTKRRKKAACRYNPRPEVPGKGT